MLLIRLEYSELILGGVLGVNDNPCVIWSRAGFDLAHDRSFRRASLTVGWTGGFLRSLDRQCSPKVLQHAFGSGRHVTIGKGCDELGKFIDGALAVFAKLDAGHGQTELAIIGQAAC